MPRRTSILHPHPCLYMTTRIRQLGTALVLALSLAGTAQAQQDEPKTPLDRLLAAGVLSPAQESELLAYRDSLNPAAIGRQIADLQAALLRLAKDKTEQLYLAAIPSAIPSALPDARSGIRIKNKAAS